MIKPTGHSISVASVSTPGLAFPGQASPNRHVPSSDRPQNTAVRATSTMPAISAVYPVGVKPLPQHTARMDAPAPCTPKCCRSFSTAGWPAKGGRMAEPADASGNAKSSADGARYRTPGGG